MTLSPTDHRSMPLGAFVAGVVFIAANVLIPLTLGDVYPFTIAPMFRDAPRHYANIRVYAPYGKLLADNSTRRVDPVGSPDPWLLRRYYDGNPVGCGVGVCPPQTLDVFGEVPTEAELKSHFQRIMRERGEQVIEVEVETVGPIDAWRVGVQNTSRQKFSLAEESSP